MQYLDCGMRTLGMAKFSIRMLNVCTQGPHDIARRATTSLDAPESANRDGALFEVVDPSPDSQSGRSQRSWRGEVQHTLSGAPSPQYDIVNHGIL